MEHHNKRIDQSAKTRTNRVSVHQARDEEPSMPESMHLVRWSIQPMSRGSRKRPHLTSVNTMFGYRSSQGMRVGIWLQVDNNAVRVADKETLLQYLQSVQTE